MTVTAQPSAGMPRATMATLMLAVFTVSVGFSVLLPVLPYLIEGLLGTGVEAAQISRHTGLLTAVYTLALFLFAPLWGRQSDRHGPRVVLLIGVLGFGATMLAFAFIESLTAIYIDRILSGMFAAAVTPVAAAVVGGFTMTEQWRARRLAFVSMSSIAGFMTGPMLGVFVSNFVADIFSLVMPADSVAISLAATALAAFLVAPAVALAVPRDKGRDRTIKVTGVSANKTEWLTPKLLILTFIVSAGVGVFEVGLALRGKQELGLTPYQIALMFTECSLVMFVIQALVFSPWFKPSMTRWLIAPALLVLTVGLFLVPWASDFRLMQIVIGAVAASAGILAPILTYWISAKAGSAQGWELGRQTAAASLGITAGAAAGGLLFNIVAIPGAPFVLTSAIVMVGFALSYGMPRMLVPLVPTKVADNQSEATIL